MPKPNEKLVKFPRQSARDILTDVLRDGARQILATAIEAEVEDYIADRTTAVDATRRRGVVQNGHLPERTIQTPFGDVRVQQPRVLDRRPARTSGLIPEGVLNITEDTRAFLTRNYINLLAGRNPLSAIDAHPKMPEGE
jgi:putative transposase